MLDGGGSLLYKVPSGYKPFVTVDMQVQWEIYASTPLAGAYCEYLVLFSLETYELPAGSKFKVKGLFGASWSVSVPLLPPRQDCGIDINTYFSDGYRKNYGEWSQVDKSMSITLRSDFTTALVSKPEIYSYRFKLFNDAQLHANFSGVWLEVDVHGSLPKMKRGFTTQELANKYSTCTKIRKPWVFKDASGVEQPIAALQLIKSELLSASLVQSALLPGTRNR
jgi:hypothetical protein